MSRTLTDYSEWRPFLVHLVHHKTFFHSIGNEEKTQFLGLSEMLFQPLYGPFSDDALRSCERIWILLKFWLECLRDGGVDLEEYGRRDTEICYKWWRDPRNLWDWSLRGPKAVFEIESFTYGPSPSDWKLRTIYLDVRPDLEYQHIPGAWDEEDQRYNKAMNGRMIYSKEVEIDLQDMPICEYA